MRVEKIERAELSAENPFLEAALHYAERGWAILPTWSCRGNKCACGDRACKSPGKHPLGRLVPNGLKDATTDMATIQDWWSEYPDAGIAMATGEPSNLIVLDVDVKKDKDGKAALKLLSETLGPLPQTRTALTPSGGEHLYFLNPGGITSSADKLGIGLDVRGERGYVVVPPSHDLYRWKRDGEGGRVRKIAELPKTWVRHLRLLSAPSAPFQTSTDSSESEVVLGGPGSLSASAEATPERVAAALAVISNDASVGWGEWNRIGMATFGATGGSEEGFRAFDQWSEKWPDYDREYTRKRWDGYRKSPPNRIGAGTLFFLAEKADKNWRQKEVKKDKAGAQTQAHIVIELAETVEFFHTKDGHAFADCPVDDHWETWPIRSKGFQDWLLRRFYERTGGAPNREALNSAIATLGAKAHFDAPLRTVNVRVASCKGKIYLDLADPEWRAVEIGADGWRVISKPPVRFIRTRGMLPLPEPKKGGEVDWLRDFLNINHSQFVLLTCWLLAALRDHGPYPILVLIGEEGTGKSTLVRFLRSLVDPNVVPLRSLPRDDRDLFIAANKSHVLAFDNVSHLSGSISDSICRLASGGGFATRQLYTDDDELLISASRPIILNGIEDFVARADLADRCIFIRTTPISDDNRCDEETLEADFKRDQGAILGALLDAVVHGLRTLPNVRLDEMPRMADFAKWATACEEGAKFKPGSFNKAYQRNRREAVNEVIESNPVADAVSTLLSEREEYIRCRPTNDRRAIPMINGGHSPYVDAAIEGEVGRLASAQPGERNQVLFKASASLAGLGLSQAEIDGHLGSVAKNIGLQSSEINATLRSGVIQIELREQFGGVRYGDAYRPTYALIKGADKRASRSPGEPDRSHSRELARLQRTIRASFCRAPAHSVPETGTPSIRYQSNRRSDPHLW